jgi:hypothetical protein
MKSLVLLGAALTAAIAALASASAVVADAGPLHPFSPRGSTAALEERIAEQFPGAVIPPQERILCSSAEHSMGGPVSYCFAEFATAGTWNLAAASRPLSAVAEPGGASVSIYAHVSWRRRWRSCHLGRGTPGVLFSNEDCGRQQLEPLSETDGELISFEVLPKLRSGKAIHFVNRDLPFGRVAPSLSRFRASLRNGVYTFTNSVGDSFRYRPTRRLTAHP